MRSMSFTQRMRSHPLGPHAAGAHRSTARLTVLSGIVLTALVMALLARPPAALGAPPAGGTPPLLPVPQSVQWTGPQVPLSGTVAVVTLGEVSDDDVAAVTEQITDAGGTVAASGAKPTARVVLATAEANVSTWLPASQSVPTQAEGYLLATISKDVPTVVALGRDADGLFHAVTVLDQLIQDGTVTGAQVRDWPTMPVRGVVEGFYGPPWSHQARLDTISYMGEQRMNTYIYAPKDDPYLRKNWRGLYPAAELGRMEELSQAAQEAHVDLVVTLSPGDSICYSSQEDYEAAVAVFEQLRGIGITSFYVALDDLLGSDGLPAPLCESDTSQFGDEDRLVSLARAQAHFLNRIQNEYIWPNGLPDLWTVPTHYVGMTATPYMTAFGSALDDAVRVQWTGRAIVTDSITTTQAAQAKKNYGTSSLVVWDNFPANDGDNQARLFLGTMPARSTDLGKATTGITANPMIQPYASRLALADYAGYSWNPAKHDSQAAHDAAIAQIVGADSGPTWQTAQAFVDVHRQWEYSAWRATDTWGEIYRFIWAAEGQDDADLEAKATVLRTRLQLLSAAPTTLASVEEEGFYTDAKPWIEVTSQWAKADLAAIDLILALRRGDTAGAQKAHDTMEAMVAATAAGKVDSLDEQGNVVANAVAPTIGEKAMSELVDEAREAWKNR